jgi:hypothetical protein
VFSASGPLCAAQILECKQNPLDYDEAFLDNIIPATIDASILILHLPRKVQLFRLRKANQLYIVTVESIA